MPAINHPSSAGIGALESPGPGGAGHVLGLVARTAVYVALDTPAREIAQTMADESIGVTLVRGPHSPVGIVSERDVALAVADGADLDRERARDLMTPDLATIDADAPVVLAANRMLANEIRHLVVTSGTTTVGVVSVRDVLGVLADQVPDA